MLRLMVYRLPPGLFLTPTLAFPAPDKRARDLKRVGHKANTLTIIVVYVRLACSCAIAWQRAGNMLAWLALLLLPTSNRAAWHGPG
jgi:hypothetical protein